VLGAKAGRERYDQIMQLSSKATHSPAIQGAAGFVAAKITNLLPGRKHGTAAARSGLFAR